MQFDSNLTEEEQDILLAEIESIVKIKIDKKLCFLQARYFPSKDSQINDLVSLPKNKGKKLVGFLLTMKSIDFVETEDKMSIELQNGFIIHSAYKIFIHNEFGEEIPAVSYMYFFDADKYRMAKNNCELQHQTIQ
ncbi:hypothetical protein ACE193_21420 [Bernardetia sp. OM2101]|uniref:hypothetical protein n=1 Tax=Bernardetia sp. OM2101 TaxID=3344876 RepID=UPI0035CEE5DC